MLRVLTASAMKSFRWSSGSASRIPMRRDSLISSLRVRQFTVTTGNHIERACAQAADNPLVESSPTISFLPVSRLLDHRLVVGAP